jgi:integrase
MNSKRKKITNRDIEALAAGDLIWDSAVPGFGARRQKSEAVSYVLLYRTQEGRQRYYTIGRHGAPWKPDTARNEARRLLGEVVKGVDPSAGKQSKRKAATVGELCDAYLSDAQAGRVLTRQKATKKPSTLVTDRSRIERHIRPLLGSMKVNAVTRQDIEDFMHAIAQGKTAARIPTKPRGLANVRGGKGAATRTVGLLGAIFSYAVRQRLRPDNPVNGVTRFADGRRRRRLSPEEYGRLGLAFHKAGSAGIAKSAIEVARLLVVTGWRSGEALGLRWADIDVPRRTAILSDTKSGRSMRPLSDVACAIISGMGRRDDCELVFPATRGGGPLAGFPKFFARIRKLGAIPRDVTPHTLRHSYASLAGDMGYSESTIAALIGHKGSTVTSRYVHAADAVLVRAADAVANETMSLLSEGLVPQVAEERPRART